MTEENIDNHLRFLIEKEHRLKTDELLIRERLGSHLLCVPNKLYKYRNCSRQNFRTLKDGNIYIPCADDFKDPFDYALNFDLSQQREELARFFFNNINQIVLTAVKGVCQKFNIRTIGLNLNMVNSIRDKYFLADGTCIIDKFEEEVVNKSNSKNKLLYQKVKDLLLFYFDNNGENIYKLAEKMMQTINETSRLPRRQSLVYCMTEDKNCGPMWENYADGYKGFCIEYDFTNIDNKSFEDIKNLIYLMPVIYLNERPVFDMTPFFELATRQYCFGEKVGRNVPLQIDLNKQLLRKEDKYSYEQEWRFAIKNQGNNLQPFPFVSAIYMGKDITENNIKHLKVAARKLNVPLYKQTLNYCGSKFEYYEVEL